jgi:signal transduction histidine kinase/DNA-binding LacI/PurR family transcriptional regulator
MEVNVKNHSWFYNHSFLPELGKAMNANLTFANQSNPSKPNKPTGGKRRVTIGSISPLLWSRPSALPMLEGIADAAGEQGVNFIAFQGTYLESLATKDPCNMVYKLINNDVLDGLVIWGSSYAGRIGLKATLAFFEQFRPLPIVSIGTALPGIPGILIDSYSAMYDMMTHLVEHHHYHKIAFIQGPKEHYDSKERFRAYCDALNKYQIPFDPDLVSPCGLWELSRATKEVQCFLDERNVTPEVIIAPNDNLAIETIKVLQQRGFSVPETIAVVGINDEPTGRVITPPLTTSNINFYERARQAVLTLLKLIDGQTVPAQLILPSNLIIRQSCGCTSPAIKLASLSLDTRRSATGCKIPLRVALESRRDEIYIELLQMLNNPDTQAIRLLEKLLENFIVDLTVATANGFIPQLEQLLIQIGKTGKDIHEWQAVISMLRRQTASLLNPAERSKAENLWYQALTMINEIGERFLRYCQLVDAEHNWDIHRFTQRLNTTFEIPELIEIIAEHLQKMDFSTYYLSLYENPQTTIKQARLVLAQSRQERLALPPEGVLFELPDLAPADWLNAQAGYSLILIPLYFETNQLGFILLERMPFFMNGIVYTSLQIQLSSALWGTLLFQKQKQTERALLEQAQNLARSNADLQQFASVASHDLQEPLRKITVFCGRLKSHAQKYYEQDRDYIDRMHNAANRLQILINDLLAYSRLTTKTQPFTPVDLTQITLEVINDLEIKISQTHASVTLEELPTINADALQMRQLFQNLISNGLKFCREDVPPVIKITAAIQAANYAIAFEDNGIGIEKNYFDRIFFLFERLHDRSTYEGSGIGLAVCKKIVERHGGTIIIESNPGEGSRFIVKLPLKNQI